MKHLKRDDGYVLVYVLIVFTILSLVAVTICSTAVKNLQAQKAAVARMEARYEAEGYLQQFIAEVEALPVSAIKDSLDMLKNQFLADVIPQEEDALYGFAEAEEAAGSAEIDLVEGSNTVLLKVQAVDAAEPSVQIVAELQVPVTVTEYPILDDPNTSEVESGSEYTYQVSGPVQYTFYDISYEGGAGR